MFFPGAGSEEEAILSYCIKCTVRAECDEKADRIDATTGVWGGKRRTK